MHTLFKSEVFCTGQCHSRGCDSFDGRVIGQVHEKNRTVDGTCLLEVVYKELSFFKCDTDGTKYYRKLISLSDYTRLSCDLGGKLCMGKT